LVLNQLQEANTKQLLVMLNLPILIKTIHQERGCVFVIFLTNLRDIFYSQEQDMWYKVDRLCSQVRQQLENKTETSNSSISFLKQKYLNQ
jgi:GTPase SAR1 family protein